MHRREQCSLPKIYESASNVLSSTEEAKVNTLRDCREQYEYIIENGLLDFKKTIVNPMLKNLKLKPVIPPRITVNVNNITTKVSVKYNLDEITSIGRITSSSIQLNGIDISRIQCIIFIVGTKIMILDTWSLYGTITKHCKTGKIYSSVPGERNLIAYNIDETFQLTIGTYNITINPDEEKIKSPHIKQTEEKCCICLDKPRTIRLSCGHACMCEDCAKQVMASTAKCPMCRASARNIFQSKCNEIYKKI